MPAHFVPPAGLSSIAKESGDPDIEPERRPERDSLAKVPHEI
jgi:hypothetical protein